MDNTPDDIAVPSGFKIMFIPFIYLLIERESTHPEEPGTLNKVYINLTIFSLWPFGSACSTINIQ